MSTTVILRQRWKLKDLFTQKVNAKSVLKTGIRPFREYGIANRTYPGVCTHQRREGTLNIKSTTFPVQNTYKGEVGVGDIY